MSENNNNNNSEKLSWLPVKFGGHYRIELATKEHTKDIGDLLKNTYVPELAYIRALPETFSETYASLEAEYSTSFIQEGISLVAVDENTGKVVGARVSGAATAGDYFKVMEFMQRLCTTKGVDERLMSVYPMLAEMEIEADVCGKHSDIDKIFEFKHLVTDKEHGGKGIATKLIESSFKVAQSLGFKMVKGVFIGPISQRVAEKNGLILANERHLLGIKDDNGEVAYKGALNDVSFKLMYKLV